jgi:hypothetical protein
MDGFVSSPIFLKEHIGVQHDPWLPLPIPTCGTGDLSWQSWSGNSNKYHGRKPRKKVTESEYSLVNLCKLSEPKWLNIFEHLFLICIHIHTNHAHHFGGCTTAMSCARRLLLLSWIPDSTDSWVIWNWDNTDNTSTCVKLLCVIQ